MVSGDRPCWLGGSQKRLGELTALSPLLCDLLAPMTLQPEEGWPVILGSSLSGGSWV